MRCVTLLFFRGTGVGQQRDQRRPRLVDLDTIQIQQMYSHNRDPSEMGYASAEDRRLRLATTI